MNKKQEKKKNSNFNTPYDDAHQTMVTDCPTLLIPVVNEVFHKNYSRNESVTLSNRNFMVNLPDGEQQARITDSVFTIRMEEYLMECQSTRDGSIIMRIFEYSTQEALEKSELSGDTLTVKFPNAAIIYLRHNERTPNEMTICIKVPGGECNYKVPIVKVQNYSVEALFGKQLFFFIPFHIFAYEKDLAQYDSNEEKLDMLKSIYADIVSRLDACAKSGVITEFEKRMILAMSKKVLEKIARKYSNVKEEVGSIMGGKVLEYEAKDILRQGISQGIVIGIKNLVETYQELGLTQNDARNKLMEKYQITDEEAREKIREYWKV